MPENTLSAAQLAFVDRYILPVATVPAPPPPPPIDSAADGPKTDDPLARALREHAADVRGLWVATKDSLDSLISTLQTQLRCFDDVNCQRLADSVLAGYTDRLQVRLIAAILDAERCPPGQATKLRGAVIECVDAFESEVLATDRLRSLDEVASAPDIGVSLNIQSELSKTLAAMKSQLTI